MSKDSTRQALYKYLDKQIKQSKPKRKNKKPEKDVQYAVEQWLEKNGFDYDIVESKSVYHEASGRYLHSQTTVGFSDIVGNDSHGIACFIELKAPGRRSTLRERQRDFLTKKIKSNCFAVVVDSPKLLADYYDEWIEIRRKKSKEGARQFLLSLLPKKRNA